MLLSPRRQIRLIRPIRQIAPIVCLIALLLPARALADFTFVQISDTHIAADTATNEKSAAYASRYEEAIRQTNLLNPAFVVHTGDALEAFREADYARFKEISAKLKAKLYVVPGNHDVGRKRSAEGPITKESRDAWVKAVGYDHVAFEQEGWVFIGLNASLFGSGFSEEKEQLDWLKAQLAKAAKKHIIVFQHYPMFETMPKDPSGYFNVDEPMRSKLIDLFAKYKVEAVLCGHIHRMNESNYKGIDFIATPSTAFSVISDTGMTGYRVFRVTPDAFTTYFVDFRTGGTPPVFGK